jgi:hypothetical protein
VLEILGLFLVAVVVLGAGLAVGAWNVRFDRGLAHQARELAARPASRACPRYVSRDPAEWPEDLRVREFPEGLR